MRFLFNYVCQLHNYVTERRMAGIVSASARRGWGQPLYRYWVAPAHQTWSPCYQTSMLTSLGMWMGRRLVIVLLPFRLGGYKQQLFATSLWRHTDACRAPVPPPLPRHQAVLRAAAVLCDSDSARSVALRA